MDLRWGLLLIGFAVLGFVYWYSRTRNASGDGHDEALTRRDPLAFGDEPGIGSPEDATDPLFIEARAEPVAAGSDGPEASAAPAETADASDRAVADDPGPSKVVAIRLMSKRSNGFEADKLVLALREEGLRHGRFGIFHKVDETEVDEEFDFSVANLVEPGTFDLTKLKTGYYPGVSIFMTLPGPSDGVGAFDHMLQTSRSLADKLDGELLDEQGIKLSIQRERYLREEVVQFEHQLR